MENEFIKKNKQLIDENVSKRTERLRRAKSTVNLLEKYSYLPKQMRLAVIMILILTVTAPLLVTVPFLMTAFTALMYKSTATAAGIFKEIGVSDNEKSAGLTWGKLTDTGIINFAKEAERTLKDIRYSVIILLFSLNIFGLVYMNILSPVFFIPMILSALVAMIWLSVAYIRFFKIRTAINKLFDDKEHIKDYIDFEAKHDFIITKYLTLEGQSLLTEFQNRHKLIFDEYYAIPKRLLENKTEYHKIYMEQLACEAKYPDIFTEYHERDNFEHLGFSNEEYKLITEHISKESEIELFLDGYEYSNNNEIALFHVILWWVAFFSYILFGTHFVVNFLNTL